MHIARTTGISQSKRKTKPYFQLMLTNFV